MKVLVTGAAGFIGSAVCLALLKRGDEVTGIDNLSDYYDVELKIARLRHVGANSFANRANDDFADESAPTQKSGNRCSYRPAMAFIVLGLLAKK